MMVTVKLFGAARDIVGQGEVQVQLAGPPTISHLRSQMVVDHPGLKDLLARSMFAVDADYASDDRSLNPDDDVACIPPVSGG